jgi:hypothetical protein
MCSFKVYFTENYRVVEKIMVQKVHGFESILCQGGNVSDVGPHII